MSEKAQVGALKYCLLPASRLQRSVQHPSQSSEYFLYVFF